MKKLLRFILLSVLLITLLPGNTFAKEKVEYLKKGSDVIVTEEKEPSVDVNTLPNGATSLFAPETSGGTYQTYGLSFARGTISCYTIGIDAYCPWTIQVGGDVITYSNVIVYLEKNYGWLNGGWEDYSSFSFKYPVNIATSTIRNEASFRLPAGEYRVRLGGNFTTAKNGIYSAFANDPASFEIN